MDLSESSHANHRYTRTQFIFIKAPTTLADVIPYLILLVIYLVMVQVGLSFWKRFNERSYNIFVLSSIIVTLPTFCILTKRFLTLLFYVAYMCFMGQLVMKAYNFTTNKKAPKVILKAFKMIFLITGHLTVISQILMILSFIFIPKFVLSSLFMTFYFIYYAILSREIVRNLSYIMAKSTGYHSNEGIPGRKDTAEQCMICTENLNNSSEKQVMLRCGHHFHEDCIKGWCVIGQNDSCYYCKTGLDKNAFGQDYWIKTEVMVGPMMKTLKSGITFSAIIFVLFMIKSK